LVERRLDAGPTTIQWHLIHEGHTVSISTIRRRLIDAGLVTPEPGKRPRSSFVRFEADLPNEWWQADATLYRLGLAPTARSSSGSMITPSVGSRSPRASLSPATPLSTPSTTSAPARAFHLGAD